MKSLSVVVVPMESNAEPYQMELKLKGTIYFDKFLLFNR